MKWNKNLLKKMAMLKHTHSSDILFSAEEPRQTFTQDNSFYSSHSNTSTNVNYSQETNLKSNSYTSKSGVRYSKPIEKHLRRNKDDYTEISKLVSATRFDKKLDQLRLNASFEDRDLYRSKQIQKDSNANYRGNGIINSYDSDFYSSKPINGYVNNELAYKAYMSDNEGTNEFNRYRRSIPTVPNVPRSRSGGPVQSQINRTVAQPYVPPPPYPKTKKSALYYNTSYSHDQLDHVEDLYTIPHTFDHQKVNRQSSGGPNQNPLQLSPAKRPYSEFNIIDDARRRTWSPPTFSRMMGNGVSFGAIRSYKSNDQLDDVAAELPTTCNDEHDSTSATAGPPRIAPVSGKLEQNAHQSLIKPIAFKPVVLPTTTQPHYGASPSAQRMNGPVSPLRQHFQQHESPQQLGNSYYDAMRAKTLSPYELNSSTMPSSSYSTVPAHVVNQSTPKVMTCETGQGNIKVNTHKQSHGHGSHDDGYMSQDYHSGSHCHSNSSHSNNSHGSVHNESDRSIDHSIAYMNNSINRPADRPESLNSSNVSRVSSHHNGESYNAAHTPSPSDSGVGELESLLREKDSTIQHLRETMEKNETALLQVCEEKERLWDIEWQEVNVEWERKWRHHQQKAFKMEQALLLQLFKLQQERKALKLDIEKLNSDKEDVQLKFNDCHEELKQTKTKLDEVNWEVCQKSGEISLLKSQLKDSKDETCVKKNEILSTKTQLKTFQKTSDEKDHEILTLEAELKRKNEEMTRLSVEVGDLKKNVETIKKEAFNAQQNADLNQLQLEMKTKELEKLHIDHNKLLNPVKSSPVSSSNNNKTAVASLNNSSPNTSVLNNSSSSSCNSSLQRATGTGTGNSPFTVASPDSSIINGTGIDNTTQMRRDLEKLKAELAVTKDDFKRERDQWLEEKNKVIRYQKHLQLNYVQMYRKNKVLESEVEQLTLELEKRDICLMDREGGKIITEEESMC